MTSSAPDRARISIIGAGPGGLTCARILQRRGLAVTVHDRDSGPNARDQGGTLDLHADSGQRALREADLLEEFFALARPEGQEMRQMNPAGEILFHHVPEDGELFKPEINRGDLRDLLLGSLQPGTVQWGPRPRLDQRPRRRAAPAALRRRHVSRDRLGHRRGRRLLPGPSGRLARRPAVHRGELP
ncbi:FAD-dependent oxidoreductase [Nonomuraea dietziae]|uniref:FAD-dependent oxidoreductase n=1 Tax=Nonomuraea dietziae TaxID=65515 RepID=UPI0031D92BFC